MTILSSNGFSTTNNIVMTNSQETTPSMLNSESYYITALIHTSDQSISLTKKYLEGSTVQNTIFSSYSEERDGIKATPNLIPHYTSFDTINFTYYGMSSFYSSNNNSTPKMSPTVDTIKGNDILVAIGATVLIVTISIVSIAMCSLVLVYRKKKMKTIISQYCDAYGVVIQQQRDVTVTRNLAYETITINRIIE